MTDDLTTWLRAIYDEREHTALAAGGRDDTGQWHTPTGWGAGAVEDAAGNIVVYDEGSPTEGQAVHIALNDPADELRDLDAKRRILDIHGTGSDPCDAHDASMLSIPCDTLLALALPHADRPGYRDEWAVTE